MDTRFWIKLREVHLKRSDDGDVASLLSVLKKKTSSQVIVCPISANTFHELLRQQDPITRRATAQLVDELSKGVCLFPREDRVGLEMTYWTYLYLGYKNPCFDLEHKVWTKLAFAFGVEYPYQTGFDQSDERAIQKSFFDRMWTLPFYKAVDTIYEKTCPGEGPDEKAEYDAIATGINKWNKDRANNLNSFPKVYQEEFLELIKSVVPVSAEILKKSRAKTTGKHESIKREFGCDAEKHFLSVLSTELKNNDLRLTLRTTHIGAMCLAAIRWYRNRRLTGNDIHDFQHAEAALAYCNMFLTEKPLATLLQQGHLTRIFHKKGRSSFNQLI
jgi:hypothetical protein